MTPEREKELLARIEELEFIGMELLDVLTTKPDTNVKVKHLQRMIRILADRLAIASVIFRNCETECGIEGEAEAADWWEQRHRMLLGRDNAVLAAAREEYRKWGEYRLGLTRVRDFLKRALPTKRVKAAPTKQEAA